MQYGLWNSLCGNSIVCQTQYAPKNCIYTFFRQIVAKYCLFHMLPINLLVQPTHAQVLY